MIKPFDHLRKSLRKGGLATTGFVERRLREVLSKLHFTVQGGKVSSSADGQVHLEFDGAGGEDPPFKVTISETLASVTPGVVMVNQYAGATPRVLLISPTIGGGPLSTSKLVVNGDGWVALRMEHDKATGNPKNTPWKIVFTTTLLNQSLVRTLGDQAGTDGNVDFPLARIVSGAVETQLVHDDLNVQALWNYLYVSALP